MQKTGSSDFKKEDMAEQYIDEFLAAFSDAIANMAYENCSVIELPTRQREIGKFMSTTLDEDWLKMRGFYINSVAVRNMTYDEETKKFIDQHRQDSLLLDANRRAARMTRGVAAGIENAGSNANGSVMGFAGVGLGLNAAGGQGGLAGVMNPQNQGGVANQAPKEESLGQNQPTWLCSCGSKNKESAKFCSSCGSAKPAQESKEGDGWTCSCGHTSHGAFCSECGSKKPEEKASYKCNNCGWMPQDNTQPPKFCPSCGDKFDITDRI
jgi:membrane protease subunit (stomatin/prohibitin family)